MTGTEALAELRFVLDDSVEPYAWSDDRLMRFLALGQKQFCRDSGFFRDSANYQIVTVPGTAAYTLPVEVIEVMSVLDGASLLARQQFPTDFSTQGRSFGWAPGRNSGQITLVPTPDAEYLLNLVVWRGAQTDLVTSDAFEIPEDFQLAPVEWAAAKCFGDHDRERQDPVKAADHLANYKAIAREGKRAFRRLVGEMVEVVPNSLYLV